LAAIPIRVAVTGTRRMGVSTPASIAAACIRLHKCRRVVQFVTGAAHGVDSEAFAWGLEEWPSAEHVVVYPSGLEHNEAVTQLATDMAADPLGSQRSVRVVACTDGYVARDDMMLDVICAAPAQDRLLLAFPQTGIERLRSGTWTTVRHARKRDIPVYVSPQNGAPAYWLGEPVEGWR